MSHVAAPLDLRIRTRNFALRVIRLYAAVPKSTIGQVIAKQLFAPALRWAPTIAKASAQGRGPNTLQN